jgi:hypothetical protein
MAGFTNDSGIKQGVFAYLSAAAVTTVTTGNTFVPILGTFVNNPMENFGISGDAIQYLGTETKEFEIDWHTSFSSQDAGRTAHFGVAINGETLATTSPSTMGTYIKYAGEIVPLSGTDVVELSYGDTIQLQLTSDTDADEVTVAHFTTSIAKFFRGR